MRNRALALICAVAGLAMIVAGLLMPAHLRAVDDTVLEKAAQNTPELVGQGLALVYQKNLGAAQMLAQAADIKNLSGREKLDAAVAMLAQQYPDLSKHGMVEPTGIDPVFESKATANPAGEFEPVTEFIIQIENRENALRVFERSSGTAVQQLLRFRTVTNTTLLPPSGSASGQALDAALALCGLLIEGKCVGANFSNSVVALASSANLTGKTQPLEQVLMDILSLGQRFNWGQLVTFVGQIEDAETLRLQANLVRKAGKQLPILFSAVQLSANPSGVAKYLVTYDKTGLDDLGASLRYGAGGLNELLHRNQRLHLSKFQPLLADWCLRAPGAALTVKWFLFLLGGMLIAAAVHAGRPAATDLERPLQVRGVHLVREFLFGLGFLLVVLLLSEPFLAQESQRVDFPLRLRLPTVGSAAPAGFPGSPVTLMNPEVLITMSIFFVLQALLYIACLVKLAEIRRQRVEPRIKLKLLENEDHLFDAGLYLGFLGTIISLILVSLGVFKQPSLMAAYSATSFGILFVVIFKIMHLRPARRKLLLEAEAAPMGQPGSTHAFAAPL